jgi:hypothetical protein
MMRRLAIITTLAAGCIDIPPFPGGDARPSDARPDAQPCDPTNADADGDGWRCDNERAPDCDDDDGARHPGEIEVCGDGIDQDCSGGDLSCGVTAQALIDNGQHEVAINGYEFTYPVTGMRDGMPETLGVSGSPGLDLLNHNTEENAFGIALFPDDRSNDAGNGTVTRISAPGPAVARYRSEWGDAAFGGTTLLSFHGDGRVARDDFVNFAAGNAQFLATYVSFDASHITDVMWPGGMSPRLDTFRFHWPTPLETATHATAGSICLYNTDTEHRIGFTWMNSGPAGPRLTEDTDRFAVEYDWIRAPMEVDYPELMASAQTMLHLGHIDNGMPCASLAGIAAQYQVPATMGSPQTQVLYDVGLAQYLVGLTGGSYIEMTPEVGQQPGPTFTIYVTMTAPVGVTVWVDSERLVSGTDYVIQRDVDPSGLDAFTILMRRPLPEGDVLRVAAPGNEPPP